MRNNYPQNRYLVIYYSILNFWIKVRIDATLKNKNKKVFITLGILACGYEDFT